MGRSSDVDWLPACNRDHLAPAQENLKLKVASGGETSVDEEAACLDKYLAALKKVVTMRRAGKFDAPTFDAYNAAMVELGDSHVTEMYQSFMLLYVGEGARTPPPPEHQPHLSDSEAHLAAPECSQARRARATSLVLHNARVLTSPPCASRLACAPQRPSAHKPAVRAPPRVRGQPTMRC